MRHLRDRGEGVLQQEGEYLVLVEFTSSQMYRYSPTCAGMLFNTT